jgi:hypothetical protein
VGGTSYKILGKRKSFQSPADVGYLLTIATSDGADDAPGSKKSGSVIAPLSQPEGLRMAVAAVNLTMNKYFSGFVRYGYIQSEKQSSLASRAIGQETNLGLLYQLSPSSILQADYARFAPGDFYSHTKSVANMTAVRMKMTF